METHPPSFPTQTPPGGSGALAIPSSKKKRKKQEGTCQKLFNELSRPGFWCKVHWDFIPGWGGEWCHYGRNRAPSQGRRDPRNSRAGDRLRPPPVPTSSGSGFHFLGQWRGQACVISDGDIRSWGPDAEAPLSTEPCPSFNLWQKRLMAQGCPGKLWNICICPSSPSSEFANPLREFWAFNSLGLRALVWGSTSLHAQRLSPQKSGPRDTYWLFQ